MKKEAEIKKQYRNVLAELKREFNPRTKGYADALEWVLDCE